MDTEQLEQDLHAVVQKYFDEYFGSLARFEPHGDAIRELYQSEVGRFGNAIKNLANTWLQDWQRSHSVEGKLQRILEDFINQLLRNTKGDEWIRESRMIPHQMPRILRKIAGEFFTKN